MFLFLCLALSFVRSSVLQERPEEHCSVREVESFHNSAHHVELEDCFRLYTKDEKVWVPFNIIFKKVQLGILGKITVPQEGTAQ